ncbi:MAG: Ig-like domain-containing protein [Bacilli bacterium]|nr:Ig-like domain-containing protein [Bacilli bacterium]
MKQMKVLGVIAMALTLGLTACGGGKKSSTHKHDWNDWVVVTPNTCTEKGLQERTCKGCDEKQTKDIPAAHTYGDWEVVTAATCQAEGLEKRVCSVCQNEDTRPIDKVDHTWGEWETVTDATCDAAGSRKHVCSVCSTEETETVAELGHNFKTDADGNIEFTWTVAPSCERAGVGTKHCERCGKDIAATEDESKALGHDVEAVGGETTPTDGTAAVRLYHCKRCDQTFMGFLANEVTNESKEHVRFEPAEVAEGEEQGARFLGRPIGNALALDADGTSVNQQNGERVYCSTETGDFIEYAFNLNATQAATLATCRLYCDAKPADYLNGTDFWAYGASNDEWTPGYYIDGGDERFEKNEDGTFQMVKDHARAGFDSQPGAELETEVKLGKRIEDYRYVLYVDDQVVDFDPETQNPTSGTNTNMVRAEFELPYTFHLHEGLNKIKFVMAGGYRSLFYKCIFRPYVAPTAITVNEASIEVREGKTAQITSSMEGLLYRSSNTSICTVDDKGVVTGVKAGTATITVSKEGNYKDAKVAVTVLEKEGIITLNLADGVIAPENGWEEYNSSYSGNWIRNPAKDATLTYTFESELAGRFDIQLGLRGSIADLSTVMGIKVNEADVAVSGAVSSNSSAVDTIVGQADLKVGENTMVITVLTENSGLYLKSLKLMPHVYAAFQTYSIEDLEANRSTAEWESTKEFGGEKAFKFNKAGYVEVSYNSTGAQKVMLQLKIAVKYSNRNSTGFWKQSGAEKTRITINGTAIAAGAEPDFSKVTDSGVSDNGTISIPEWFNIIEIDLQDGANTIKVEFIAGSYSYYLGGIALAK